jgi:Bacterial PH domain
VSSQHDDAPARPDEAGVPVADQPGGSPAGSATSPEVGTLPGFGAGPPRQEDVNEPGFGQTTPARTPRDRPPWKSAADGRVAFRRGAPFVIWWAWIAFAIFNVVQIAIPDHDYFSIELAAGLLGVTAIMYACTVRPKVLADPEGVLVHNPFRSHRIRWGALEGVYLGDSVEFSCTRPAPKKGKTIYCWALYSGRRSRMKSQVRAQRTNSRMYGAARGAALEAQDLARQDVVQLMAAEIGRRTTEAKQRGVPGAVLESSWAWLPIIYVLVPAALLLGLILGK